MTDYAFVNGDLVPSSEASVSVFDRGLLFGEAVYEMVAVLERKLVDFDRHFSRFERSLAQIGLQSSLDRHAVLEILRTIIAANDLIEGAVYLQITAGNAGERNFLHPENLKPTIFGFSRAANIMNSPLAAAGVRVVFADDLRWKRRDIKSTNMLPTILAKRQADRRGAYEAWLVEDGLVTEGSSSSAFIVVRGEVITRDDSNSLLAGCTADALKSLAQQFSVPITTRAFTVAEAMAADEAFLSSATNFVLPVTHLDGAPIGTGAPGPITRKLQALYREHAALSLI